MVQCRSWIIQRTGRNTCPLCRAPLEASLITYSSSPAFPEASWQRMEGRSRDLQARLQSIGDSLEVIRQREESLRQRDRQLDRQLQITQQALQNSRAELRAIDDIHDGVAEADDLSSQIDSPPRGAPHSVSELAPLILDSVAAHDLVGAQLLLQNHGTEQNTAAGLEHDAARHDAPSDLES